MTTLLYSALFEATISKIRTFDVSIRTVPTIQELYDVDIYLQIPAQVLYDEIIYYMRGTDAINNPFQATKDDASSFFSVNTQVDQTVNSTYISTNLKVIASLSEALNRPLSQFDTTLATSSLPMTASGTDTYVALDFEEILDFTTLEIVRPGIACAVLGILPGIYLIPSHYYDFIQIADITNVINYGVLQSLNVPVAAVGSYCAFYYCVLDIPNSTTTYYFSFTASSVGFMLIDNALFLSQIAVDSTTPVTGSIQFTQGHHTILIKQFATSSSANDQVRLQFKTASNGTYVDFTPANLATVGAFVETFPIYLSDIINQSDFADVPAAIVDASLDSLYMTKYRPIIVIARANSELLVNELNRMTYARVPNTVLTSPLISGSTSNLVSGYDFPILNNGCIFNGYRTTVPLVYITYLYSVPTLMSKIEFRDSAYYNNSTINGQQCSAFSLTVVDNTQTRLRIIDLWDMIDLNTSINISTLQSDSMSGSYLRICKSSIQDTVVIVFTKPIYVIEVSIVNPVINTINWGAVATFKVSLEAVKIVKMIEGSGQLSVIGNTNNLIELPYEHIGYIPSIFNSVNLPTDIRYGAEFIMFSLLLQGQAPSITTLGSIYDVVNTSEHNAYNVEFILNYKQMSQTDKRYFSLVTDLNSSGYYDFAYLGYSTAQDVILQTNFTTVTMTVTNTSGSVLNNYVYNVILPNIGIGYSCVNQSSINVPVAGITSSGVLTSSASAWDTNNARILITTLAANASITLTFTQGSFSNPTTVTGTIATTYTYLPDTIQLPLVAVNVPSMAPEQAVNIYALDAVSIPAATGFTFSLLPSLTVATVEVTELLGNTRANVEITVDISDLQYTFKCPFRVYDSNHRSLDTVGLNVNGTVTTDWSSWTGTKIIFNIPSLAGGIDSLFFIRVGNFQGVASSFLPNVQSGISYNYHFAGCLIDSVTGSVSTVNNNVMYAGDKYSVFNSSFSCIQGDQSYALLPAVTNTTNFSLSFWFMTVEQQVGIMCLSNTTTVPPVSGLDFHFTIDSSGYIRCTILSGGGATLIVADKMYCDNQWHHVCVTCSSTAGITLYVDTIAQATSTITARTITTAYALVGWANGNYFAGGFDELYIYTKCLNATDVVTLYAMYDGTVTHTQQYYQQTAAVCNPVSRITNLSDISSLQGTPILIYKYVNINETIIRAIEV